jgi:preprotein translocase subunit SecD
LSKETANTDSLSDWLYNPNIVGPSIGAKKEVKPGKVANAIAFTIVFILVAALALVWLGVLAVLIMIVFGLSFLKAYAAGVLFNMVLVTLASNKKTK